MGENKPQRKRSPLQQYAVYSNMAFEMGIIIAGGVFGGIKLDEKLNLSPLFTIVCSMAAIGVALYIVIRSVTNPKKSKNESKNTN